MKKDYVTRIKGTVPFIPIFLFIFFIQLNASEFQTCKEIMSYGINGGEKGEMIWCKKNFFFIKDDNSIFIGDIFIKEQNDISTMMNSVKNLEDIEIGHSTMSFLTNLGDYLRIGSTLFTKYQEGKNNRNTIVDEFFDFISMKYITKRYSFKNVIINLQISNISKNINIDPRNSEYKNKTLYISDDRDIVVICKNSNGEKIIYWDLLSLIEFKKLKKLHKQNENLYTYKPWTIRSDSEEATIILKKKEKTIYLNWNDYFKLPEAIERHLYNINSNRIVSYKEALQLKNYLTKLINYFPSNTEP